MYRTTLISILSCATLLFKNCVAEQFDFNRTGVVHSDASTQVTCNNCSAKADFTISVDGLTATAVVNEFYAMVNLTIIADGNDSEFDIVDDAGDQSRLALRRSDPDVGPNMEMPRDIFGYGIHFNPTIHGLINTTNAVNFTYGFEVMVGEFELSFLAKFESDGIQIPSNSSMYLSISHPSSSHSFDLTQSMVHPLQYSSPDPNDQFDFQCSLRVEVDASEAFGIAKENMYLEIRRIDTRISQVLNATSDCQPATNSTQADQIFSNLTHVVPTMEYIFGGGASFAGLGPKGEVQLGENSTLPSSCLAYSTKHSALETVTARSAAVSIAAEVNAVAALTVAIAGGLWLLTSSTA